MRMCYYIYNREHSHCAASRSLSHESVSTAYPASSRPAVGAPVGPCSSARRSQRPRRCCFRARQQICCLTAVNPTRTQGHKRSGPGARSKADANENDDPRPDRAHSHSQEETGTPCPYCMYASRALARPNTYKAQLSCAASACDRRSARAWHCSASLPVMETEQASRASSAQLYCDSR